MIKPQALPDKAIEILTARLADEQEEFYFYISASAWCRLNGYENSSRFFEVESHGEECHYKNIINFLGRWNHLIDFKQIEKPLQKFSGLEDVFEQSYQMEARILGRYDSDAKTIWPIDQNVCLFIQDYVRMQGDAVTKLNEILKKMYDYKKQDPALLQFDKEVFTEYGYVAY